MNSLCDVWKTVLERLKHQLSDTTINTWFDEVTVVTMEDSALVLHCGNSFKKNTIEKRFMPQIKEALRDIFSSDLEVKLLDDEQLAAYHGVRPDHPEALGESDAFSFETYVVGPQNKMAYAAARSVAEKPAGSFNPLFIYGDSGLGKTHLLHAIARQTRRLRHDSSIVLVKGVDFTNDLIESIRGGTTSEFRNKYQSEDLLLVDDIQFIAGKQQTQNEFFHTFNNIYEAGHQIVITSDRPPLEMSLLDDRLRTRFEGGLMADIQPPDLETRMAIIRNKAAQLGLLLSDEAVEYIAENITANIRQLEGVIKRLTAYKEILDDVITIDSVKRAIKDVIKIGTYIPTPDIIIKETAKYYSLKEEDLRGQNRSKNTAMARQVSMYLIRSLTNLSLKDIGTEYEDRNHATVLASIRKVEDLLKTDSSMAGIVRDITSNINSN